MRGLQNSYDSLVKWVCWTGWRLDCTFRLRSLSSMISTHYLHIELLHAVTQPSSSAITCLAKQASVRVLAIWCRLFERQYIFVAATLPSEGKKSIANDLKRKFPDLVWLAGHRLHQGLSTVTWNWQETTQSTWKLALQVVQNLQRRKDVVDLHVLQVRNCMLCVLSGRSVSPWVLSTQSLSEAAPAQLDQQQHRI